MAARTTCYNPNPLSMSDVIYFLLLCDSYLFQISRANRDEVVAEVVQSVLDAHGHTWRVLQTSHYLLTFWFTCFTHGLVFNNNTASWESVQTGELGSHSSTELCCLWQPVISRCSSCITAATVSTTRWRVRSQIAFKADPKPSYQVMSICAEIRVPVH